ncbi:hypothetical protein RF11_10527 [Thelohanellus kitauei]|uniref:Uncharacterized protein n=1 Tax=Thelohanellus kitauei TaxID=669202 RepID=A0A0C2I645_THEKT|nr:hypothetical protein RF11_10527 [Thelohanellus kitauei]
MDLEFSFAIFHFKFSSGDTVKYTFYFILESIVFPRHTGVPKNPFRKKELETYFDKRHLENLLKTKTIHQDWSLFTFCQINCYDNTCNDCFKEIRNSDVFKDIRQTYNRSSLIWKPNFDLETQPRDVQNYLKDYYDTHSNIKLS